MTSFEKSVLTKFADHGVPASRYELLGDGDLLAGVSAVKVLLREGLLDQSASHDSFGSRRFRVSSKGLAALGRGPAKSLKAGVNGSLKRRLP